MIFTRGSPLWACLLVLVAVWQVQARIDHSLIRRSHISKDHQRSLRKRDVAPLPAQLTRAQCAVKPDWLINPWYYDPEIGGPVACSYVWFQGIQAGECHGNSRIMNNVFSFFTPYSIDHPKFSFQGGPYGDCYGFQCAPPAEVLVQAPNENFGCYWWLGEDKKRPGLIPPPDMVPGITRTIFPIQCPNNLQDCYSKGYYNKGGPVADWADAVPDTCAVNFPIKKDVSAKDDVDTACHGRGLGCDAGATWLSIASANPHCKNPQQCQKLDLSRNEAYQYKTCDFNPLYPGCKATTTGWANTAEDKSACSCGEKATEKSPGNSNSAACDACLKGWTKGKVSPGCYSKAIVPNLKSGKPAHIDKYMVASKANVEKILAMFPRSKPCRKAGDVVLGTPSGQSEYGSGPGGSGIEGSGDGPGGSGSNDDNGVGSGGLGGGGGVKGSSAKDADTNPSNGDPKNVMKLNDESGEMKEIEEKKKEAQGQGKGGKSQDELKEIQKEEEQQKQKQEQMQMQKQKK